MKSVNIKGSQYITVNERLKYFCNNSKYNNFRINEELIELNENEGVFKVTIFNEQGEPVVSAHAQEYRDNSYINKTSFLENGFTSALGRALGYLGIGIDTAIASADEVKTAINNQDDNKKWLSEEQLNATLSGTKEQAVKVFATYKMKKEYKTKIQNKFNI
tara:strand:+ start:7004 stop:7486 length:483 start_codon:yes stop_codon:yes gene_type:complete